MAEEPSDPGLRHELAGFCMNLGCALFDLDRMKEAEQTHRRCQEHLRRLADDFPSTPQYRFYLGSACINLGHLYKRGGRLPEAEAAYRERLAIHQKLAADFPQVAGYLAHFAGGHYDLAKLCRLDNKIQQARTWAEAAIVHGRRAALMAPTVLVYRISLRDYHEFHADTLLALGDHAVAATSAAQLPRLLPDDPKQAVVAAGLLARAAVVAEKDDKLPGSRRNAAARDYAAGAVSSMKDAIRRGFRDVDLLRTDASLSALQTLPGVRELLTALADHK